MPDKMTELKPCPFCGGEAETRQNFTYYAVACNRCQSRTNFFMKDKQGVEYKDALVEAINAWNRRSV